MEEYWLQWSRPQLRTETATAAGFFWQQSLLQWSRPQLRTETWRDDCQVADLWVRASMEPSSAEDGNQGLQVESPHVTEVASMEPSSAEDGNPADLAVSLV